MIIVHAALPLDPDHRDEALDLIRDMTEKCPNDEGTIEYQASTDVNDPNLVRFVERYEDEEAVETHRGTDHYEEFGKTIQDMMAGKPDIDRYEVE